MPNGFPVVAALALLVAGCATSAGRIGADELTQNGRLVSGVELRKLFTQATVEGKDPNGVEFTLRIDDDGNYKGVTTRGDSFVGKWSIDGQGRVCFDTVYDTIRGPCAALYVLNGKYYALTPSGVVLERAIRRPSPVSR